jgi:hypothetical protein
MEQVITIGLDIAKHVFHAHGVDERGAKLFSKRISRSGLLSFFVASRAAWWRWRHALARITGAASCSGWGTRFG